jgi:hypothetical protein
VTKEGRFCQKVSPFGAGLRIRVFFLRSICSLNHSAKTLALILGHKSEALLSYIHHLIENPFSSPDLELPDDDLLPAKQALLSAWGLGLSHFLKAERLPTKLHGALRVLLMDEEEIEGYKGDPRKDKVRVWLPEGSCY